MRGLSNGNGAASTSAVASEKRIVPSVSFAPPA